MATAPPALYSGPPFEVTTGSPVATSVKLPSVLSYTPSEADLTSTLEVSPGSQSAGQCRPVQVSAGQLGTGMGTLLAMIKTLCHLVGMQTGICMIAYLVPLAELVVLKPHRLDRALYPLT